MNKASTIQAGRVPGSLKNMTDRRDFGALKHRGPNDFRPRRRFFVTPAKALKTRRFNDSWTRPTTTTTGLRIRAELDTSTYRLGIKVSDEELAGVRLEKASFHGDWNYTILPKDW